MRDAALQLRDIARRDPEVAHRILSAHPEVLECWQWLAHDYQIRPADAPIWLLNGGRGSGKTRSAAEDMLDCEELWGPDFVGVLCSKTLKDVRKVQIHGPSGLRACSERRGKPIRYRRSDAEVCLPHGGVCHIVSSEKPDDSRGLNSNYVWGDEVSSWRNGPEIVSNLILGCRITPPEGQPLCVFSTTPKPNETMLMLLRDERWAKYVRMTTGSTFANADNLDARTLELYRGLYEGTRIGQQELDGLLLEGAGALVSIETIDAFRVNTVPELVDVVVSLDPSIWAVGKGIREPDPAGLCVVGVDARGHAYVIEAFELPGAKFSVWARAAVALARQHNASRIVAEVNQGGGGIVEAIDLACEEIGYHYKVVPVWARESKVARAEPIAALCEKGRVHHVGVFRELEKQLTTWLPGQDSPNALDAWSQGIAHLLLAPQAGPLSAYG